MSLLTLNEATKAAKKAKSTILEAIKNGRLSATRNDLNQWQIDPAELFRVYPLDKSKNQTENQHRPDDFSKKPLETAEKLAQMLEKEQHERERERGILERERQQLQNQIVDLKPDRDHWRHQATALLTDQSEKKPAQKLVRPGFLIALALTATAALLVVLYYSREHIHF